jgi:predicted polyphosphate/ATP-dependent NAD kinase
MPAAPYKKIHVVINPASGKAEPVLHTLNESFHEHDIDWECSITHKYGDATEQATAAIAGGADLIAGYGGDGTQHEIANAVLTMAEKSGRSVPMGVLPGGPKTSCRGPVRQYKDQKYRRGKAKRCGTGPCRRQVLYPTALCRH